MDVDSYWKKNAGPFWRRKDYYFFEMNWKQEKKKMIYLLATIILIIETCWNMFEKLNSIKLIRNITGLMNKVFYFSQSYLESIDFAFHED